MEQEIQFKANKGKTLEMDVQGQTYLRLPIKTRLITTEDNIFDLVREYVSPHLKTGDWIFVSEKIVATTQNRIIKIRDIKPTWFSRFLSRKVRNKYGTKDFRGFGHGTPMGMELLIREAGYPRVVFAAAIAAATRPLGIKGPFYYLIGKKAKSIDCPMSFSLWPFNQYAKLAPQNLNSIIKKVKKEYGNETIILDANYLGAISLAKTTRKITEKFIGELFKDNPLGQSEEMTPFCIVRKK